eukprot:1161994-Pelagomonas_calceolata.AAC.8
MQSQQAEGERAHACPYVQQQQPITTNAADMVRLATCACSRTCLQLGQAQPWMAADESGGGEDGAACYSRRGPWGEA